jgi:predicted dehydrogenase
MRFGIIGTGLMGCEHIRNVLALPDATITAVADPDADSRAFAQLTLGEDHPAAVCTRASEVIGRDDVDAIVVATPNVTHAPVLAELFEQRPELPVLVEKPLCTTVADCRAVVDAAARRPGLVWVGLEYRYMPPVARLLEEVRAGSAGDVRMVFVREHRFPFLPKVGNWNRFNRNTGGTLVEKCCHFFDLMRLVAGADPVRVLASGSQDVNHLDEEYDGERPDILDNAYVIVDFANGVRGCLDLCMFAEASRNEQELSVVGPRGKVEAFVPDGVVRVGDRRTGATLEIDASNDTRIAYEGFHHGASYLELLAFCDATRRARARPLPSTSTTACGRSRSVKPRTVRSTKAERSRSAICSRGKRSRRAESVQRIRHRWRGSGEVARRPRPEQRRARAGDRCADLDAVTLDRDVKRARTTRAAVGEHDHGVHGPIGVRDVRLRHMHGQTGMKRDAAARHFHEHRLHARELRTREQRGVVVAGEDVLELPHAAAMRTGEIAHRATLDRRTAQRDPRRDRVRLRDRPIRLILMGIGAAPARALVQRLIVPKPHGGRAQQLGRGLADARVERERPQRGEVLPQVLALLERLLVRRALVQRTSVGGGTLFDRGGDEGFEMIELVVGEQSADDHETVAPERVDERGIDHRRSVFPRVR